MISMADYDEDDIHYMSGFVDGMVFVAEIEADDVRPFDPDEWADHYGEDIIYSNVPLYKSEADRQARQDPCR